MKSLKATRHAGYTIVEMLVTVTIFSLSFLAIAAIFLGFSGAQTRAGVAQRLLNEGNFLLELVTREIRMHAVDYSCTQRSATYACLRSVDGQAIHIKFDNLANPKTLQVCKDYDASPCPFGSPKWITLNPTSVILTNVSFQTHPNVNPLSSDVAPAQVFQPMTTILMSIQAGQGRSQQIYDLQTAVSSRAYSF